jgi:hypothetical protein
MSKATANAKWRQWRADYYGIKPIVSIYASGDVHRVKAHEPTTVAAQAQKSSRFGKFFKRA